MSRPTVVTCSSCDGLAFRLADCACRRGADTALAYGSPWSQCRLCTGIGTVARPCDDCHRTGRRRAQLVLTVADLDTGTVASAEIVPGVVTPVPDPPREDGWRLDLLPVVRGLAAEVGVPEPRLLAYPGQRVTRADLPLPHEWRPGLPAELRRRIEADALARWSHTPWWVYTGHSRPAPVVDPAVALGELCRLAELLMLDLVVEARWVVDNLLGWQVRFDLPGSGVPELLTGWSTELAAAATGTTAATALDDLAWRGRDAPAHHLRPAPAPPVAPEVDLDQLERRIVADCPDGRGAQAIWRNGRWWHAGVRTGASTEHVVARDTGQLARYVSTALVRAWEPPPPARWGAPVPGVPCPDCPTPGVVERPICRRCAGARRLHHGAVVTVTDLRTRAVHLNWPATRAGAGHACDAPAAHRLVDEAQTFGVRPADLVDTDHGRPVDRRLLDGPRGVPRPEHWAALTRGRAAARVVVHATTWGDAPGLTDLIRLAVGLDLAVHISVRHDADTCAEQWSVRLRPRGAADDEPCHLWFPGSRFAVARCLEFLEVELAGAVPTDPDRPLRVPQQPAPATVVDPTPALLHRARADPGVPAVVVVDRGR